MNTAANSSSLRLVTKVSALTQAEVMAAMPTFSLENGTGVTAPEISMDGALYIHFHSQDGAPDTDDEKYFFNGPNDDGYGRSRLKIVIDAYYNHLTDKTAVQAVTLNNPTYTQYTGTGFNGTATSYSAWWWAGLVSDSNRYQNYKDTRFETTLGGTKQAFALSTGDLRGATGVPIGLKDVILLTFKGTNRTDSYLRSPGNFYLLSVAVELGDLLRPDPTGKVSSLEPVRPSLYLSID